MKRILFVPDAHWPFTDLPAWRVMMRAAKFFDPDIIAIMGDFCDFYSLSSHGTDPRKKKALGVEIGAALKARAELDSLGAKRKIYVAGNHEHRMERFMARQAPELVDLVDVPSLLELHDNGWEYLPYREYATIGKLFVTHDVNGRSGMSSLRQALADFGGPVVVGHTHRMESVYIRTLRGGHHVARSFGWLGSPEACKDYMHQAATKNWVPGFGIGYMTGEGIVHLQDVPIINGACMVHGKLVR